MSKEVVRSGKVFINAYDLTTTHTSIGLTLTQEALEANCMLADGAGTDKFMQEWLHGLKSFELTHSGYTLAGTGETNTVLDTALGTAGTVFTVCGATGASGDPAYSGYTTHYQHQEIDGSVGGMASYAAAGFGQGTPCFRGRIMGIGAKTETGNGSIYQLGAITAGTNALYAALHVTAVAGSDLSLVVDLYSAPAANFESATKRLTFTEAMGITSEIKTLATTVTDTWWRATWTLGGSSESFTIALNAGIINV